MQTQEMEMSLGTMRDVYGVTSDSQLLVNARSESLRPALERRVQAMIGRRQPGLELASTGDLKAQIKKEINQQFGMFNAIVGVAIIVSLLGVINTLAMSVMERTREIGVLRAIGSSRWLVRRTMLDESLLITIAGSLAGLVLGGVIAFFWVQSVESLLPGISFRLPVGPSIIVVVVAIVLGVIASVLPARRAAGLDVIDALNYE
jgi:putative ABC transport system permease protein